jgi:hypothetical protein
LYNLIFYHTHTDEMILPKGGVNWQTARARLPPWKAVLVFLTRTRLLVSLALAGLIVLLWRGIFTSTKEMSKYVYFEHVTP